MNYPRRYRIRWIALLISLLPLYPATSQAPARPSGAVDDLHFIEHLYELSAYDEMITALQEINADLLPDSLQNQYHYLYGMACYYEKKLSASAEELLAIKPDFPAYDKAMFFSASNYILENKLSLADSILSRLPEKKSHSELIHFQKAGIALLQGHRSHFLHHSGFFTYTHYAFEEEEKKLLRLYQETKNHTHRSPFIAGALSAMVPGLGKIYGGKPKQGIAAFIPISLLGIQFYENAHKRGWKSPYTYFYGGLFSLFYIGNIWGSALSVKIASDEWNEQMQQRILFNLHMPLRLIYPD